MLTKPAPPFTERSKFECFLQAFVPTKPNMRKIRGFKLGNRLTRVSGWIFRKYRILPGPDRLCSPENTAKKNPIAKLFSWGCKFTKGARSLCSAKFGSGYLPIESDLVRDKAPAVPKGHLAVYVGQNDGEFRRVLVPVMYFNHPLFGELLREAEEEFGFQQPGGITIPCPFTEFERVKTRIESGLCCSSGCGFKLAWKRQ